MMEYRVEWIPYLNYLRNVVGIDVLSREIKDFREAIRFARDGQPTEWRIIRLADNKTVVQTKGWNRNA